LGFWITLSHKEKKTDSVQPLVLTYEVMIEIPPFEQKYAKQNDGNFHLVKNFTPYKIKFNSSWGDNSESEFIDSLLSEITENNYSWLNIDSLNIGKITERTRITNEYDSTDIYEKFVEYEVVEDVYGYVLSENSLKAVCENYELDLIGQYSVFAVQNLRDYYENKIKAITNDTTKNFIMFDEIQNTANNFSQILFSIDGDTLTLSKKSATSVGVKFSAEVK
jgi:hypothetical protein